MSQIIVPFTTGELPPSVPLKFVTNNGTAVPIANTLKVLVNQAAQGFTLSTSVPISTDIININVTDSLDNILLGRASGNNSYTGFSNTAIGTGTLQNLTSGTFNVAMGQVALNDLTSGTGNVAIGYTALSDLTTGSSNVGIGQGAMTDTTGSNNVAVGFNSMHGLAGGSNNIALGYVAGDNYTGTESSNIAIGSLGTTGESNVIRIGTQGSGTGQQNAAFMAGITGVTVASSAVVGVDSFGELSSLGTGSVGQVLTSTGTTSPTWQSPGELLWQVNTTTPITVVANNGYIANESSATLVYNLPATAAVGNIVSFTNISSTKQWQIQANTGQTITLGTVSSTSAGTATSTQNGDTVTLICTVANTNWQVISSIGNITLA